MKTHTATTEVHVVLPCSHVTMTVPVWSHRTYRGNQANEIPAPAPPKPLRKNPKHHSCPELNTTTHEPFTWRNDPLYAANARRIFPLGYPPQQHPIYIHECHMNSRNKTHCYKANQEWRKPHQGTHTKERPYKCDACKKSIHREPPRNPTYHKKHGSRHTEGRANILAYPP